MSKSYIKCLACNTINLDRDYCSNCGAIINVVLKRQLENENKIQEKIKEDKSKAPSAIDIFLKKGATHPNSVLRAIFQIMYSIWLFVAMLIGWLIALIVAAAAG